MIQLFICFCLILTRLGLTDSVRSGLAGKTGTGDESSPSSSAGASGISGSTSKSKGPSSASSSTLTAGSDNLYRAGMYLSDNLYRAGMYLSDNLYRAGMYLSDNLYRAGMYLSDNLYRAGMYLSDNLYRAGMYLSDNLYRAGIYLSDDSDTFYFEKVLSLGVIMIRRFSAVIFMYILIFCRWATVSTNNTITSTTKLSTIIIIISPVNI